MPNVTSGMTGRSRLHSPKSNTLPTELSWPVMCIINYNCDFIVLQPTFKDIVNLAAPVDPQYGVIFNIVLWMSILIGVSVLFISIGIWNMDPGRDSIIYRMTSQRMKKD